MDYNQDENPRRQKWIRPKQFYESAIEREPAAKTIEELRDLLQKALIVEHFTIPPYLCALYSIKDGTNDEAASIIRTVAVEEMLHMVMVANLMNAFGMEPQIKEDSVIMGYPNPLPESSKDFTVNLLKFSKESINTFLRIEKPAKEGAEPETGGFHSIGQFYEAIRESVDYLEARANEKNSTIFIGDPKKQVTAEDYYGAGGSLFTVSNLEDVKKVIDEIEGQGEGIDGTIEAAIESNELAHYFRFNQVFFERKYKWGDNAQAPPTGAPMEVDWDGVYNMEPNPKMEKYNEYPWLKEKMREFNRTYIRLLNSLHETCNGNPGLLRKEGIPLMYQLKTQAVELMKIPSGNGNYTAGPSFEYVPA